MAEQKKVSNDLVSPHYYRDTSKTIDEIAKYESAAGIEKLRNDATRDMRKAYKIIENHFGEMGLTDDGELKYHSHKHLKGKKHEVTGEDLAYLKTDSLLKRLFLKTGYKHDVGAKNVDDMLSRYKKVQEKGVPDAELERKEADLEQHIVENFAHVLPKELQQQASYDLIVRHLMEQDLVNAFFDPKNESGIKEAFRDYLSNVHTDTRGYIHNLKALRKPHHHKNILKQAGKIGGEYGLEPNEKADPLQFIPEITQVKNNPSYKPSEKTKPGLWKKIKKP